MKEISFWSRLPAFYDLKIKDRRKHLLGLPINLQEQDFVNLDDGLSLDNANIMSENVLGTFSLPLSIAANFIVNDRPVLVPMVTEEPSIVAACSKMAKIAATTGGFIASSDEQLLKGQLQIINIKDSDKAYEDFLNHKLELIEYLDSQSLSLRKRLGGVKDITARFINHTHSGVMMLIELLVDVKDAMGANIINTLMELLAKKIEEIFCFEVGIAILSNYADQRLARSFCKIPINILSLKVAKKMIAAHNFAQIDIYRATTHNKGIMNGIDALAIATGNDFRALEAAAHAYAYTNNKNSLVLTKFVINQIDNTLDASIELPLSVGVVGGIRGINNAVEFSYKILQSFGQSNKNLACLMASVGLAQCLAAIFALSSDGIQKGHMNLHQKKYSHKE